MTTTSTTTETASAAADTAETSDAAGPVAQSGPIPAQDTQLFADGSAESPYGPAEPPRASPAAEPGSTGSEHRSAASQDAIAGHSAASAGRPHSGYVKPLAWSGSPYEPLPNGVEGSAPDPSRLRSAPTAAPGAAGTDAGGTYSTGATAVYIPSAAERGGSTSSSARRTKSRALAAMISSLLGLLLVAGALYLIGEFGFRIQEVMLSASGQVPDAWDITWVSVGGVLLFAAVALNGWSPWATVLPGLALTAAGVWSIVSFEGADRVASSIDDIFARPEMVGWGVTGWMLALGLVLLGASLGAVIARAAGRRRGRP